MNILAFLAARKDWIALIIVLLLSMIIMNSSGHESAQQYQYGISKGISFIVSPLDFIPETIRVWKENKELHKKVMSLESEQNQWREAVLENIRLRKMLDFSDNPEFEYLACEVIAKDPAMHISGMLINRGADDSLTIGMLVVTSEGLVGVIHEVGKAGSIVQLATDRNFALSARTQRSRVDGIIRWAGGFRLKFADVPKNLDVRIGDRIITSGLGGFSAPGVPIGVVESVERKKGAIFQEVQVKPFAEFARLEEVFVLKPIPEEKEAEKDKKSSRKGRKRK